MRLKHALPRSALCLLALLITAGAFVRYASLTERYAVINDEGAGIADALDHSYASLLAFGASGQLNTSPLHYLLDKTWMELFHRQAQQHFHMNVFFRLPPAFYGGLSIGLVFLLWSMIGLELGLSFLLCAGLSLGAALMAATNLPMELFGFLVDRPYALWLLLTQLHILLFLRSLRPGARRLPLWIVNFLLSFTTFTACAQVLAAVAVRLLRNGLPSVQERRNYYWEIGPAGFVGTYYFLQGAWQGATGGEGFVHIWSAALYEAVLSPTHSFFEVKAVFDDLNILHPLQTSFALALFLLAPYRGRGGWRDTILLARITLLFAIPVSLMATFYAHAFSPKYMLFAYPYLMLAQPCLALWASERAGKFFAPLALLPIALWSLGQAWYRLPVLHQDAHDVAQIKRCLCLYREHPVATCPPHLDDFRSPAKNAIDVDRLNWACMAPKNALPADGMYSCGQNASPTSWKCAD